MDVKDLLGLRVQLAPRVLRVIRALLVRAEKQVPSAPKVLKEMPAQLVLKEMPVQLVLKESLVRKVSKVLLVKRVLQVLKVRQARLDRLDLLDLKVK